MGRDLVQSPQAHSPEPVLDARENTPAPGSTASKTGILLSDAALRAAYLEPKGLARLGYDHARKAFASILKGQLELHLPNGKIEHYGAAPIEAPPSAGRKKDTVLKAVLYVHRWDFFKRLLLSGHVGAGESFVDGDWSSPDLLRVFALMLHNEPYISFFEGSPAHQLTFNALGWMNRLAHALRSNTLAGSSKNIQEHYDLGNAFFSQFLDTRAMLYSSAYYQHPELSLEEAQQAKLERLCRILKLQAEDHLLEIGCGWGAMAIYAAKHYGCTVSTITLSQEQARYTRELVKRERLEDKITVVIQDYRLLRGQYDKLVSIEMIEAVGDAYYEAFFRQCNALLKPNGLMALQMITCPDSRFANLKRNVDFIQKHIFPGSLLPSLARLHEASLKTGTLYLQDVKDLSSSYARTLAEWHRRFGKNRSIIEKLGYSQRFCRKWEYYLLYCQAAFQMRHINVVQALYSKPNNLLLCDADLRLASI